MKKLIVFVLMFAASCEEVKQTSSSDMGKLLSKCKGHAVVRAKGYNSGNLEIYHYYLIIVDDSLNAYEYIGADYHVEVGDTLK